MGLWGEVCVSDNHVLSLLREMHTQRSLFLSMFPRSGPGSESFE